MSDPRPQLGLYGFITALACQRPRRLAGVLAVQVGAALGQAVGVLLLIPLLGAVGVTPSAGIARWTRHLFLDLGVRPTLAVVLAVYVVVAGLSAALNAYQVVLSTRYRLEFVDGLRTRLYTAISTAQWRHLMGVRQSDVLAVLTTSVTWVGIAALGALQLVVGLIVVCAQLAAALRISPGMTGLAAASGVALLAIVWPLVRRSRRLGAELVEHNQRVLAMATGFLDGLKLARAFGREPSHVHSLDTAVAAARGSQVEFARAGGVANAIQTTLTALLLGVTVFVGVRVLHVPIASLLVVAFVFTRVVSQLTTSQMNIQQVAQGLASFDEVMRMIAGCEFAQEPAGRQVKLERIPIGSGVALCDVRFAYPGRGTEAGTEALRGISLEIPAGSLLALAGPSGAGKTTVADLAAGLIVPSTGVVTVNGSPLSTEHLAAWRQSVALVPQDPFLFHDSIEANLLWAKPQAAEAEVWEALRLARAADFVQALPGGLAAVVGDRGMRLSGGERQRLALARALLRAPDLLILDEATSSLDTENESAIQQALASLRGKTTVLLIAHRLSTLRDADEIVVLDRGRVSETGSWEELSQVSAGRLSHLIEAAA